MVKIQAILHSLKTKVRLFWNGSIRRRMVLSFSAVTLLLMVGFSYLIFNQQRDFLYEASSDRALGMAGALASSSASWVLANDLAGLEEVLNGFSDASDLKVALVLSLQGEVLGATDQKLVGQFVSDKVSIGLLQSPAKPQVLVNQSQLVDAAFPIMVGYRHIGWARVELTRASSNAHLRLLGIAGLGFSMIAVVASLLVATWLAQQLMRSLYHLMQVAQIVERGARNVRSTIVQDDEVGKLAHSFNLMLDTLNDSEEKLGRLNRLYAAWTESTEIIVRESDEQVLLDSICRILAERVPFELVWIGVPGQDGWVQPVASGGKGIGYLSKVKVSVDAAKPEGRGPTGIAIRDGVPSISNDFLNEFKTSPWQAQASNYNYRSVSVFPISRNGRSYGAIAVYACEVDFFSKELIVLLGGLADDISFALNNLDREKQRQADLVELERAAKVFEHSKEGIMVTDAANRIISVNRSFTEISGYKPEEVIGKNPNFLSSGRHNTEFYRQMWNTLNGSGSWQGELWNRRKNGDIYPESLTIISVKDNRGEVINYIAIFGDISERKQAELRIQQLAHFDALTGLPNRVLFTDRLEQAILYAQRNHATLALLFLDLDRFKQINDTLGHGIGDLLLKMVAQRLLECIRDQDTVSRQGGDEFIAVLPGADAAGASLVADKMLQAIIQPYAIEGHDLRISSSIGIAIYPEHAQDADTLIRYADVAMYQAKAAGRNHYVLFNAEMNASAYDRLTLETYLRAAVELKQFEIYYQPQVDLTTGSIIGCEALIRWHHPEIGTVSPADFIPIAEETGIIGPISDWILDETIRQCKVWLDEGMRGFTMGVNLSAIQFRQRDLHEQVSRLLEQYQVPPSMIDLELTEGILIEGVERTMTILRNLNALGVRILIDDFGTGYSSLSYLKRFPIHKIKIDQSFVRDVVTDSSDATMVQTIVLMANSLKLEAIAEGVETEEQADFLRKAGCKMAQGYLFGRPMPADAFEAQFVKSKS